MTQREDSGQPMQLLQYETIDDGASAKMVFRNTRADGRTATFETGSYLAHRATGAPNKHDVCISTAGGCTRHCTFCAASDPVPGFERLLTAEEIVGQVDYAVSRRNPSDTYANVVGLMGNGEPPDNPATPMAIEMLMRRPYSLKRVMVSTIGENLRGIATLAERFARSVGHRAPVILHFSLHVADDVKRRSVIPGRRSIADISALIDQFAEAAYDADVNPFPVRINVVLMESPSTGFTNATPYDAERLVEFMQSGRMSGRRMLKLSAYNPIPGRDFRAPIADARALFARHLINAGVNLYTFQGSGIQIDESVGKGGFACGQLRATTAKVLELNPRQATG